MKFYYHALRLLGILLLFSVGFANQGYSQCSSLPPLYLGSQKFPDKFCSPVTADINYTIGFGTVMSPINLPAGPNYDVIFIWGDGTPADIVPITAGSSFYDITRSHAYPTDSDCEYQVIVMLRVNSTPCIVTQQLQFVSTWRTDEFNGGNVQLISPVTGTSIHEVCEGEDISVIFEDDTQYNCNQFYTANYPPGDIIKQPNQQYRWQQIVYNTPMAGAKIPNISVNGVPVTGAGGADIIGDYQDPRGVVFLPPLVDPGDGRDALIITAPGGYTPGFPQIGDEFEVTIKYWNICNPYDDDFSNGNTTPSNGNLIDGDNPPVVRTAIIRIIDAPDKPLVDDVTLCYNDNATLTLTNAPTGTINWYETLSDALTNTNVIGTGSSFAVNTTNAPVGVTDFFVAAIAGNSCISDIEQVFVTRREELTRPSVLVLPQTDVCPNTTYVYRLPNPPAVETTGGPTEFIWSIVPAANANIISGQGTEQVTIQTTGALGNFNLRVERRYTTAPTCTSPPRTTTITVRANPTVSIAPDPLTLCEGETPVLMATIVNGFGSLAVETWTGSSVASVLDDLNSPTPTILPTATAGNYNFTFTVTNSIGCSGNDNVDVDITPGITNVFAGNDQDLCFAVPPLQTTLDAANPSSGTGTWTYVSGPDNTPTFANVNLRNTTVQVDQPGVYVFRWRVVSGSCSPFDEVQIDFGQTPNQPTASDLTFCGLSGSLNGTTPTFENAQWSFVSGPVGGALVFTDATSPTSTVTANVYGTYQVEWRFSSGSGIGACSPKTDIATIIFNEPATATVPLDFTICVDQTLLTPIALSGVNLVGGGTTQGRWQVVTGTGVIQSTNAVLGNVVTNATSFLDHYVPNAGETSVQVRMVAQDPDAAGPCTAVNSNPLTITIDRKPTDANAGSDVTICDGAIAQLNATAANNGGTGVWSGADGIITDVNLFNTTVSGLTAAGSPYTFTWTVTSLLDGTAGACTPTSNDVQVFVNPLPLALDPAPADLCETTEGTFTTVGVTLSTYDDDVTGNAANRTVDWFATLADRTAGFPTITSVDITNNDILFTRVTDTSTPSLCSSDGSVTFTVNGKPLSIDQVFSLCEDLPIGSNTATFDLTDPAYLDDITASAPDRSISWHITEQDAIDNVNLIPAPNAFVVTGTTVVYARVINTITGCFNVAEIGLTIKAIPRTPTIAGKLDPCRNGTELYRAIDPGTGVPYIGGTYTWTYPPDFQYLGGGQPNDFYLLLTFPNTVTNDLKVKVTVNGCESAETTQSITVSPDPLGYVINPNPDDICEGGIYQYTVSPNNATSTYSWQVFTADDGNPGGGLVVDGQTTGVVLVQFFNEDVILRVTESNASGCAGPSSELLVPVNLRPIMDDLTVQVCSGDIAGITLVENATSPVAASTFQVQVPAVLPGLAPVVGPTEGILLSDGIFNDSYKNQTIAPVLSVLYRVQPISFVGCKGDEKNVTLDVKAEPVMDINLGKTVCSDASLEITLKGAIGFLPADKFVIESITFDNSVLTPLTALPATGVLLDPDAIFNSQWENVTSTTHAVSYMVRPYSELTQCFGNPAVPIVVNIQPKPVVNTIADLTICSGDVLNIPLTSANIPAATYLWSSVADPAILGASSGVSSVIDDQLFNTSLAEAVVTYEIVAVNTTLTPICTGPVETIQIRVRPSPAITTPIERTVCSDTYGGNTSVQNLTTLQSSVSTEPSVTYTWFTNANDFDNSQILLNGGDITAFELTHQVPVFVRVLNTSVTSGCYKDATVTFSVNPTPELTLNPAETIDTRFNITCNGLANGQVAVSAMFGNNHMFNVDGGSFVPALLFSGLAAGDHTFQTTNVEGCVDTKLITLVQPDPLVPGAATVTDVSCFNDPTPDGQIHITATGGTNAGGGDPLIFSLLQDPLSLYDPATELFTGLRAGSYTVRVEDKNGCTQLVPNITVGQPADLNVAIEITSDYNGNDVSCAGAADGQVSVLTATGGTPDYTFRLDQDLSNISGQTDGSFEGLSANLLYTITVTDSKGCEKGSLPVLLIDPIPLFPGVVGFNQNVCEGGDPVAFQQLAAPFGGIGNYTYLWEESTDNVSFAPAAGINNDALYDPSTLLTDRYYRRRVFSSVPSADPACPNEVSDVVKVTVRPLPTATLTAPAEVCEDGFFILDFAFQTGQSPYTFEYNDGTTTFNLIGAESRPVPVMNYTATTTYTLTKVIDFYGCTAVVLPPPVTPQMINMNTDFTVTPTDPQCSGGVYTFSWTRQANVEYTFSWNDGTPDEVFAPVAATTPFQVQHTFTSANVSGSIVVPVTLTARSTILAACTKQSPAQGITIYPTLFLNVAADRDEICSGESVNFVNASLGGTSHRWYYRTQGTNEVLDERNFAAPSNQTFTFTNLTTLDPIVYEVVYEVTNGNCSNSIVTPISVYRGMNADFSETLSEYVGGEAFADFQNTSTPLDAAAFRYEWEFGVGAEPLQEQNMTPGQVRYTSIGEKEVRLTMVNLAAETNGLTCVDQQVKTIQVLLPPLRAAFKYTPQASCYPATIQITENLATGDSFEWKLLKSGEVVAVSNEVLPTFEIANAGFFVISLTTTNSITGQSATADNSNNAIEIVNNPFAAFEPRPEFVYAPDSEGMKMLNRSARATDFFWDFGDGGTSTEFDPRYFYQVEGKYMITLVASNNFGLRDLDGDGNMDGDLVCYDTATYEVTVKETGRVRIPNAFTPDASGPNGGYGDGLHNDVFRPVMTGVDEFQMQIFDRWGNLVFESKDTNQGWDGYDRDGRLMPSGVYVYKLTIRLSNNSRTTQVGDVTLIR